MAVKGFTFWKTYWDVAQELSATQQGALYRAICEYMFTDADPEDALKGAAKIAFKALKPNIKTSKNRSEIGAKGGKQTASKTEANAKQTASKSQANGKQVKDKGQDKDKDKDKGQNGSSADFGIPQDAKAALIDLGLLRGEVNAE